MDEATENDSAWKVSQAWMDSLAATGYTRKSKARIQRLANESKLPPKLARRKGYRLLKFKPYNKLRTSKAYKPPKSKMLQVKAAPSFSLFSKLPLEIRLQIWRFVCSEGRVVDIWFEPAENEPLFQTLIRLDHVGISHTFSTHSRPPPVLQVSREARIIALEHYVPEFGFEVESKKDGLPITLTRSPQAYINWEVDIFCTILMKTCFARHYEEASDFALGIARYSWPIRRLSLPNQLMGIIPEIMAFNSGRLKEIIMYAIPNDMVFPGLFRALRPLQRNLSIAVELQPIGGKDPVLALKGIGELSSLLFGRTKLVGYIEGWNNRLENRKDEITEYYLEIIPSAIPFIPLEMPRVSFATLLMNGIDASRMF